MKRTIIFLIAVLTTALASQAQINVNGNRMLIQKKDGTVDVKAVSDVQEITVATVDISDAEIAEKTVTDASITADISFTGSTNRVLVAIHDDQLEVPSEETATFVKDNYKFDLDESGEVTFKDLKPNTKYIICTVAYDEYGIECRSNTKVVSTKSAEVTSEAKVGDYLYADGTWSTTLRADRTCVGIVFSTKTNETEMANGFTHGYAVAVKDIPEVAWTTGTPQMDTDALIPRDNDADVNDMNGYAHSLALMDNQELHPAALAAHNYAPVPAGASQWFLPSIGQLVEICVNLGNLDKSAMTREYNSATWSKDEAAKVVTNINAKLASVGEGNFTNMSIYTWSSSEFTIAAAYYLYLNDEYNLSLLSNFKSSKFAVRPIIAF